MRSVSAAGLQLEPVTSANAAQLWHILQQAELRTYQDLPNVPLETFTGMVAKRPTHLSEGSYGRFEWLICAVGAAEPGGWVSLRIPERERDCAEIGYSLLAGFRGRGVATTAVRALLDEAFSSAALKRVRAYCLPANRSSRRLLARLRFVREGLLPHGATVCGQAVDVIVHVMERSRWFSLVRKNDRDARLDVSGVLQPAAQISQ